MGAIKANKDKKDKKEAIVQAKENIIKKTEERKKLIEYILKQDKEKKHTRLDLEKASEEKLKKIKEKLVPEEVKETKKQNKQKGISISSRKKHKELQYDVIKVDPNQYTLRLEKGPKNPPLFVTAPLLNNLNTATDGAYIQNGKHMKNGKQTNNWVDPATKTGNFATSNGIFGLKKNGTFFCYRWDEQQTEIKALKASTVKWAYQNGPVLRNSIRDAIGNQDKNKRAVIGSDGANIVFIFTHSEVTWEETVSILKKEGVNQALYLDGLQNVGYKEKGNVAENIAYFDVQENKPRLVVK